MCYTVTTANRRTVCSPEPRLRIRAFLMPIHSCNKAVAIPALAPGALAPRGDVCAGNEFRKQTSVISSTESTILKRHGASAAGFRVRCAVVVGWRRGLATLDRHSHSQANELHELVDDFS